MSDSTIPTPSPADRVDDVEGASRALALAVRDALRIHKRDGSAVPVWRNERCCGFLRSRSLWIPSSARVCSPWLSSRGKYGDGEQQHVEVQEPGIRGALTRPGGVRRAEFAGAAPAANASRRVVRYSVIE